MKLKNSSKKIVATVLLCNQMLSPMMAFAESISINEKEMYTSSQEKTDSTEEIITEESEEGNAVEKETSDELEKSLKTEQKNTDNKNNEDILSKNYDDLDVAQTVVTSIPRGDTAKDKTMEARNFEHSALETTGIFLPKGQEIKIVVDEEPENLSVLIGQYGEYAGLNTEENALHPKSYALSKGENIISRPESDGMVYLENKSDNQTLSVSLEGGVEVPKYVLGKANSEEDFEKMADKLKDKVPFFEIEGKYTFGTFQMSQLEYLDYKNKERLPQLLNYWDQLLIWTNEVYGFNQEAGYAAAKNLNQRIHITNPDSGAGYASATSKRITFQVDTGASKDILSGLPNDDQWGLWHEIGHTYQTPYYIFEEMVEVTVNISANYIRNKVGFGDRTEAKKADIEEYLNKPREEKNYIKQDPFVKLAALWTLQRVFGADFFPTLSQEYRTTPSSELPKSDSEERIQNMIQMMSKITNRNLAVYFDYWGLDASDETWKYCNQLPNLEKDIWLDIAGFEDRYELLDVLPKYTVPTGDEIKSSVPLFSKNVPVNGLKSVPYDSKVNINAIQYADIGIATLSNVKVTNENKVSNNIPITGEVTGGDAVKFRGSTSAYRIIAPDATTKTFSVIGNGTSLHGGGWPGSEYASIVQYDSKLKTIKNQVTINGSGEGSNSNLMQEAFDGKSYEVGDYVRINHVESQVRLDRYEKDKLLEKDNKKTYWYELTKDGWQETSLDLEVVVKGRNFTLGQKVKPEELIELPKDSNLEVESITFKKAPDMSEVGETTAEVLIKTTLGTEQIIPVDNIKVTGGDAVKFRGNTSAYRIIAPDATTKTFSVIGNGTSLHGGGWPGSEYASIVQYDSKLKTIKNQVTINGSGEGSNSNLMQEAFDGKSYEVGDYVRINHVESQVRLDRYEKDKLLEKDNKKTYWYELTKDGWQETSLDLEVVVKGRNFTLGQKVKPEELIELPKDSNLEVESITFKKAPDMSEVGETTAEVLIKTTLGTEQIIPVDNIKVTGGDAVKFRGNTSAYRIIAPDATTKTFSVIGNGTSLHGGWSGSEYASIVQYDSKLKTIKNQVTINGSGEGSNSNLMQEAFDGKSYEVGDYVRINHVESQVRLDRYEKDKLLEKDNKKTYWYELTKDGWQETSLDLEVVAKGGNFTLGQKVKPEELIELPKDSNLEIESITFKKAPDMSEVGETTAEVLIKTTLGTEQIIPVDNIKVTGGDAVKFRGSTSAYRIIAPDATTKTFSVIGNGTSLHGGGWPGSEYASIVQYDSKLKTIKNQVTINGSGEGSNSNLMQEAFDGKSYEVGDYVRINHVESQVRLDRYEKDKLLEKDNKKTYWYELTKDGWQEVDISPKVLPVSNATITMAAPIRAAELVEVTPHGELTIEKIEVEKEPKYSNPGEIEVPVKVTDSLGQVTTIIVPVTVTGGDAVKVYGNYADAARHQIIAPDAKTRTFSVLGNGSNLHSGVTEEYVFIKHFDRSLNNIKNEVSINGSGNNSDSQMIKEKFDGKSYEIGDYVQIYHKEAHVRMDRYIKDELQPKEQNCYYWYEMTASGWAPLAGEPEKGSVSVDGYQYGDINLTGTFSGDIKRGRLTINQKIVSWGGTFRDGEFTYYIGAGRIKDGDQATIDFLNSNDEVIESYEIHPTSPSGKLNPTTYMLGDSEIRTTFEGDVKRARLVVDNVVVSVGGTILDGNILRYYVNPAQIKKDSNVILQGYNSSDQPVGDPVKVDVTNFNGTLTKTEYVLNSQWIKGTFEGNVKKAQLKVDDKVISSGGTFKSDGTFEYYVNPVQIKKDSKVYLTLYDGNGNLLEDEKYTVSLL
ncbi:immunoglobulin-like domain-containing protein [Enterococcus faecalis]|uniref:immunoglobulin-like domain-containing protein n=1 Tax=Enterococcus faecalis TaxID=1351 RepID=UPI001363C109|nr:immunoglobulin-like domain-containing protein [Enterococcus faecalis]